MSLFLMDISSQQILSTMGQGVPLKRCYPFGQRTLFTAEIHTSDAGGEPNGPGPIGLCTTQ